MSKLDGYLKKLEKEWNCPDLMDPVKQNVKKIPFSSPELNYATYGGICRNVITEFCGLPGGGKSTTAIDVCHNAIALFVEEHEAEVARLRELIASGKKEYSGPLEDLIDQGPKNVLYVDLEHTFDWKWASKMGIAENSIRVMQPPDVPGEKILQAIQDMIETREIGLVVLDSVPSIVTQAELEKKYGERTVASLAGLMTIFLRKIVPVLTRNDCTMILINQVRVSMDNPYAIQTPGGEAMKFYATTRLYFRLGSPVDFIGNDLPQSAENPAGYKIAVKLLKQKGAAFDRKLASYYLMAGSGIRPDFDYAKLAIERYGIIKKNGGWFTMLDPYTGEVIQDETGKDAKVNGQVKVYDYLQTHSEYYESLKKYITDDINEVGIEAEGDSTSDEY